MGEVAENVRFSAQWAYKEGDGQDANPFPKNSVERSQWALEMSFMQQQELTKIRKEIK